MATLYTIGIDFGTANSCVAFASYTDRGSGLVDPDPLHRPEVVTFHGRDIVPTALHLGDGQKQPPTFGRMAEERGTVDPARLYTGFKLNLGHPEKGRDAFLMAKYFLKYLRQRAEQYVPIDSQNEGERVETVVGHPVQWSADQREATLQAAQEAGFPNVRLEEESLAALYCHVFDERSGFTLRPGSFVLTIDMGGGTTDFAFLQIPEDSTQRPVSIPVHPSPSEGRSYGGRDLDRLLLGYLSRHWNQDLVKENAPALMREVRAFKEAFSNHISEGAFEYESKMPVGDTLQRVSLGKAEFETLASAYIDFFSVLVRGAVEEANLRPSQVSHIILTGGHSRWYFVEKTLGEVFPHLWTAGHRTIFRHTHPEQSVARGLAYDPLVRSDRAGLLTPMRRATHAVWLDIPEGVKGDPVLLIPRGQLLPYETTTPLKFQAETMATDQKQTTVRVRFLSGQKRLPLIDRSATFQRGFWEQVNKSLATLIKRGNVDQRDRFEIQIDLSIDEHELIVAEMIVTRFLNGRPADVQKRTMQVNVGLAMEAS